MNRTIGKANLEVFSQTLCELAEKDSDVRVVTSDSRGSGKLVPFGERFPDQIVEVGIAEQNLVGIAAGLACAGKNVFAVSPACFLTARALEQIKNDVCYSDVPVTLVGISAGVSYGALGSTHHSLHDFAVLRAIHNITILAPADNHESRNAILAAYDSPSPAYIRFGKKPMPHLYDAGADFAIDRAAVLLQGDDVLFIATGETVAYALDAAYEMKTREIGCTVLSVHTIKPLDAVTVLEAARSKKAVVTVEEHSVYGGLGEAVASLLMQNRIYLPMGIVGIPDEYTITGNQTEIFGHYGISGPALADKASKLLT
ncbi:transketolase family protein [candidate division KSB1 bacterium]|nr:transketolase family protein [candidate division KSB1 bacterium]